MKKVIIKNLFKIAKEKCRRSPMSLRLWWTFDVLKKDRYEFEAWTINNSTSSAPTKPGEPRALKISWEFYWHKFNLTLEQCEDLYQYHIKQGHGAKFYLDRTKELSEILASEIHREIHREMERQGVKSKPKPKTLTSGLARRFRVLVDDVGEFWEELQQEEDSQ